MVFWVVASALAALALALALVWGVVLVQGWGCAVVHEAAPWTTIWVRRRGTPGVGGGAWKRRVGEEGLQVGGVWSGGGGVDHVAGGEEERG